MSWWGGVMTGWGMITGSGFGWGTITGSSFGWGTITGSGLC